MSSQQPVTDPTVEASKVDAANAADTAQEGSNSAPTEVNGKSADATAAASVDEESRDSTVQSQSGGEEDGAGDEDDEGDEEDEEDDVQEDEEGEADEGQQKNGKHAADAEVNGAAKGHKRTSNGNGNGNGNEAEGESDSPSKKKAKADENVTPAAEAEAATAE